MVENKDAAPEPTLIEKEDCLYLNMWVPAGEPPAGGWPVQIHIHGGWLQIGNAMQSNAFDPFDLMAITDTPRIIVSATYRLNLFGFLTSPTLAELGEDPAPGNYGFWDQRAALEWTAKNISHFGGNPDNITVGGHSAGAYSAFFQLYYDTYLPTSQRLIKRAFLYSNAVGVQPNPIDAPTHIDQFNELCSVLSIPPHLPAAEKLSALRAIHSTDLAAAIPKLKLHTFRACTDSSFVFPKFLHSIHDGTFTSRLATNNIQIMLGDLSDEWKLYRIVNPPSDLPSLKTQLQNYYPLPVVEAMVAHYPLPGPKAPIEAWIDLYGHITADCQAHATVRGLSHALLHPPRGSTALPLSSVHRYRIAWRAAALDDWLDPDVGVCHGADQNVWYCSGHRAGLTEQDKRIVQEWLKPFSAFLAGKGDIQWGTKAEDEVRELGKDGEIRVVRDGDWARKMEVWDVMTRSQLGEQGQGERSML